MSLVLEVQQVLSQFVLGDLIEGLAEVGGKLPDDTEVCDLRLFGEPGELQVLMLSSVQRDRV